MTTRTIFRQPDQFTDPPYLVDESVYALAEYWVEAELAEGNIEDHEADHHIWELANSIQQVIEDYEFK